MEMEDDMIVLVIAGDEDKHLDEALQNDNLELTEIGNILETAEKHGVYLDLDVKSESADDYDEHQSENIDYIQEQENLNIDRQDDITFNYEEYMKQEKNEGYTPEDDEYIPNHDEFIHGSDENVHKRRKKKKRSTKSNNYVTRHKVTQEMKSFVEDLRQEYEELQYDEGKLINTLEQIMRDMKPPEPPKDFYVINGIMFECVICGHLAQSLPAAERHYQEKHGPRYLICYACGVDFRCTTNLYKHEKRCKAADARIVLQARAAAIGCKARSRSFLWRAQGKPFRPNSKYFNKTSANEYPCTQCSAVFRTIKGLLTHNNTHPIKRPYRCQHCSHAYTSRFALNRHTQTAHSDVEYICDHCSRSFKTKYNLVVHLDRHLPQRKFECSECDRRFASNAALVLHVDRVHRNLPPPCACQLCPKRYPRMSVLKEHMKKVHGLSLMTRTMLLRKMPAMSDEELKDIMFNVMKLI